MVYVPRYSPSLNSLEDVRMWVEDELQNVSLSVNQTSLVNLKPIYADVDKPRDGMIVHADGVHFNPGGGGAGAYEWVNGAWHKLGAGVTNVFPAGTASVSYACSTFGSANPDLQVNDLTSNTAVSLSMWAANFSFPRMHLAKSQGAAVNVHSLVAGFQSLGGIAFLGSDGVKFQEGAGIISRTEGTPAVNSMPGHLAFMTTPSGSATVVERVLIDSRGNVALHREGAVATSAVDGFAYISTCPGAPTGVPSSYSGQVPIIYDTTNDTLNVYDAGWKTFAQGATDFYIDAAREFGVNSANSAATNTTNINNALAAASTASGRGTVVLPSGTLSINNTLTVPARIRLIGQGMGATVLQGSLPLNGTFIVLGGSFSEVCDLGINALAGGANVAAINITANQVNEALVDRVNIEGNNNLQWGVRVAGSVGGYFNRVSRSRFNNCFYGVELLGTNALEMLLSDLNIGSSTGGCSQGIRATANSGYFSMVKVETNSCTDCGLFSQDCNYEAVECLMDNSANFGFQSFFTTTTGMPLTGWYLRLTNCRASSGGSGFRVQNQAPASAIVNVNMNGCASYLNGTFGYLINAASTPANTRVTMSGCSAYAEASATDGDGMSFNFVNLALSGCSAFDCGKFGPHTADGIMVDTGCTGRVVGCIGSGNTSQQVNITPASAVLGINNTSTNTRTVAQLPSASAVGANSRAYVTDATAVTFSTVVAGGGVNVVPVYSDGTSWRIG